MLSRVADSLYWMSRYLERAEHSARVIDTHLNLMLDMSADSSDGRWRRVLSCLPLQSKSAPPTETQDIIRELTFSTRNRSSIVSCISAARENARQVREQVSTEMWTQLNRLFHEVKRAGSEDLGEVQPLEFLTAVKDGSLLLVENNPGQVTLYSIPSMEKRDELTFPARVSFARFSEDAKRVFVLTNDHTAYTLNLGATEEKVAAK